MRYTAIAQTSASSFCSESEDAMTNATTRSQDRASRLGTPPRLRVNPS